MTLIVSVIGPESLWLVADRRLVAWRHRKGGVHKGGGGHQFYTGPTRDSNTPSLPTIGTGLDIGAIVTVFHNAVASRMLKAVDAMSAMRIGLPDMSDVSAEVAKLPDKPDEELR
jgi:hypothetical protein